MFHIATIIVSLLQCGSPSPEDILFGHCLSWPDVVEVLYYGAAILNAVMDWATVAVAVIAMQKVHMSKHKRRSVIVLILLGGVGSVMSVARLPYIHSWKIDHQVTTSIDQIPLGLTSMAECALTIVALSCVALRPLVREMKNHSASLSLQTFSLRTSRSTPRGASRLGSMDRAVHNRGVGLSEYYSDKQKRHGGINVVSELDVDSTTRIAELPPYAHFDVSPQTPTDSVYRMPVPRWPATAHVSDIRGEEWV